MVSLQANVRSQYYTHKYFQSFFLIQISNNVEAFCLIIEEIEEQGVFSGYFGEVSPHS